MLTSCSISAIALAAMASAISAKQQSPLFGAAFLFVLLLTAGAFLLPAAIRPFLLAIIFGESNRI